MLCQFSLLRTISYLFPFEGVELELQPARWRWYEASAEIPGEGDLAESPRPDVL